MEYENDYENEFNWIWVNFDDITEQCHFCGDITRKTHFESCPSQLINIQEANVQLWENYMDSGRTEEELAKDIGKQMMFIADAIVQSQKNWSSKLLLERADEVLNNWSLINEFANNLNQLDILVTAEEVLDFFNKPTLYQKEFMLWLEYYCPNKEDETWQLFVDTLQSLDNGGHQI